MTRRSLDYIFKFETKMDLKRAWMGVNGRDNEYHAHSRPFYAQFIAKFENVIQELLGIWFLFQTSYSL